MRKLLVFLLFAFSCCAVVDAAGTTGENNRRRHVFRSLKGIAKMVVKSIKNHKNHKKNKPVKDPCDIIDYPSTEFYQECLRKKNWPKFPEVFQPGDGRKLQGTDNECSVQCRPKFSPQVFNSSYAQELRDSEMFTELFEYITLIRNSCANLEKESVETPQELLACHIYFTPDSTPVPRANDVLQPYATGPLRTSANKLNVTSKGEFQPGTFTNFFDIDAMAQMIAKDCFLFTPKNESFQSMVTTSFTSSEEYSSSISSSNGINVNVKAGFGPFSVHAGYNKQVKASTEKSSDKKVAYGENVWYSPVGTIENTCLTNLQEFQKIKQYFSGFVKDYLNNATEINDGGVIIPTTYQYGVSVKYKFTTSYEATTLKKQNSASTSISAGASAAAGGFSGSLSTTINNAISSSSTEKGTVDQVFVTSSSIGVDSACIKKGTCSETVLEASKLIKNNLNKIGTPLSPLATIDITQFAENFFLNDEDDSDLSSVEQKLKDELSYFECVDSTYFYKDGFGNRADIPSFNPPPRYNSNDGLVHCGNCNPVMCKSALYTYPLSSFDGMKKALSSYACLMYSNLPQNAFINDVCETSLCTSDCSTYNPFMNDNFESIANYGTYYFQEPGVENCGSNGLQSCWQLKNNGKLCWSNDHHIIDIDSGMWWPDTTYCKPNGDWNPISSGTPSETCKEVPQCQEVTPTQFP